MLITQCIFRIKVFIINCYIWMDFQNQRTFISNSPSIIFNFLQFSIRPSEPCELFSRPCSTTQRKHPNITQAKTSFKKKKYRNETNTIVLELSNYETLQGSPAKSFPIKKYMNYVMLSQIISVLQITSYQLPAAVSFTSFTYETYYVHIIIYKNHKRIRNIHLHIST